MELLVGGDIDGLYAGQIDRPLQWRLAKEVNPIKSFGIRTELLNNINNAISG